MKTIQTDFIPENYAQLMTYLKVKEFRLGLLINFGLHKAYSKRVIFDERREREVVRWDKGCFQNSISQELIDAVIASIRRVDQALGVAYHNTIYQAALGVDFRRTGVTFDDKVRLDVSFENIQFSPFEIDYWLAEKSLLLGILAGKDKPRLYDLSRMRSYLKRLNLHHGLIAFWSTKNLQLYGIYEP